MNTDIEDKNKVAFVVTTPPNYNLTTTAINLIKEAVNNSYHVLGVFFYQQGVLNASKALSIPSDEFQTISQWLSIKNEFKVPLYLCATAAEKHGLLSDEAESLSGQLIYSEFDLTGLGSLVELSSEADKVIQL